MVPEITKTTAPPKWTASEINAGIARCGDFGKFLRVAEAERSFLPVGDHVFESALELGAGNAWQTEVVASHCKKLICTDLNWVLSPKPGELPEMDLPNVEFAFCDALDLSRYAERSFDLIFSSHMMQQLPDPVAAFKQCRRVLREDGIMIFSVPNSTWRLASAFLHTLRTLKKCAPQTPGKSIFGEARDARNSVWLKIIDEGGFEVRTTVPMPFYAGDTGMGVVKLGNSLGLSAATAYVISAKAN